MEGLDFLLNELKKPQAVKETTCVKAKLTADIENSKNINNDNVHNNNNSDSIKVKKIESGLKDFINDLADEEIRNRINTKLQVDLFV